MEILKILPKNVLSRLTGQVVAAEKPAAIATRARDWFIKRYNINMAEAELPLEAYPSIAKMFIRKLKPGVRPLGAGLVHPCDGQLTCAEVIENDSLIQAKGQRYKLSELLASPGANEANNTEAFGTSAFNTAAFSGGAHLVYYLCPTDYHRVHSPIDGEIVEVVHVPGELWPVNQWSVENIANLFSINERVIFNYQTPLGPVSLVMVGATNVGKITVSFDEEFVTNSQDARTVRRKKYPKPVQIKKGDELGVFNMGSTVVLIYSREHLNVLPKLGPVKLGESL